MNEDYQTMADELYEGRMNWMALKNAIGKGLSKSEEGDTQRTEEQIVSIVTEEVARAFYKPNALDEVLVCKYFSELFPNYAYTDSETAIDLMRGEILALRNEVGNERAYNEGYQEHISDLLDAAKPFALLLATSAGRIPTERLSFADWHKLSKAVNAAQFAISGESPNAPASESAQIFVDSDPLSAQKHWRWKIEGENVYVHCGDGEWRRSGNSQSHFHSLIASGALVAKDRRSAKTADFAAYVGEVHALYHCIMSGKQFVRDWRKCKEPTCVRAQAMVAKSNYIKDGE